MNSLAAPACARPKARHAPPQQLHPQQIPSSTTWPVDSPCRARAGQLPTRIVWTNVIQVDVYFAEFEQIRLARCVGNDATNTHPRRRESFAFKRFRRPHVHDVLVANPHNPSWFDLRNLARTLLEATWGASAMTSVCRNRSGSSPMTKTNGDDGTAGANG